MGNGEPRLWIFALVAAMLVSASWLLPVRAQSGDFPPWPIIYDGTVMLDGDPLKTGTLSAQIGDWVSTEIPVLNGWFDCADPCLILGPPTSGYIGAEVTFHLKGIERPASLEMNFPALIEPDRRTVALEFKSGTRGLVWLWGSAGALAVLVSGTVIAMMFTRREHS
jgi:hypothetical protein